MTRDIICTCRGKSLVFSYAFVVHHSVELSTLDITFGKTCTSSFMHDSRASKWRTSLLPANQRLPTLPENETISLWIDLNKMTQRIEHTHIQTRSQVDMTKTTKMSTEHINITLQPFPVVEPRVSPKCPYRKDVPVAGIGYGTGLVEDTFDGFLFPVTIGQLALHYYLWAWSRWVGGEVWDGVLRIVF